MVERTGVKFKDKGLLKARESAGLEAFRKLQKILTKKDIANIEKSHKLFKVKFTLG